MPRQRSKILTEAEQRLMEAIWSLGPSSVAEVLEHLPAADRPAFNSVQTLLRILEDKRFVRHTQQGRAFIYHPLVERAAVSQAAIENVVERFFDNSAQMLAVALVKSKSLSERELDDLQALIDEARSK